MPKEEQVRRDIKRPDYVPEQADAETDNKRI